MPLLRAIKARIEGLGAITSGPKDGADVYYRNKTPFLQLEIRRDHMSLDLWLPAAQLEEARASGIARAHPFLGDEAVKVRFERAEDLSRIARWIEGSYAYAPERAKKSSRKKSSPKPVEKTTPLLEPMPPSRGGSRMRPGGPPPAAKNGASTEARPAKPVERPKKEAAAKRPAAKTVRAKKAANRERVKSPRAAKPAQKRSRARSQK